MSGTFYGVGVGPGDPELITLKAMKIIQVADVIVAPITEKNQHSLALQIAAPFIAEQSKVLKLTFPMLDDQQELAAAWQENVELISTEIMAGNNVVFLTLGDPLLYSTYIPMLKLLEGKEFKIITIPGINAFTAISSQLNYPLTEGSDILTIIPAMADTAKMEQVLAYSDCAVFMKLSGQFSRVYNLLDKHQRLQSSVMVSRCGLHGTIVETPAELGPDYKPEYLTTLLTRRGGANK